MGTHILQVKTSRGKPPIVDFMYLSVKRIPFQQADDTPNAETGTQFTHTVSLPPDNKSMEFYLLCPIALTTPQAEAAAVKAAESFKKSRRFILTLSLQVMECGQSSVCRYVPFFDAVAICSTGRESFYKENLINSKNSEESPCSLRGPVHGGRRLQAGRTLHQKTDGDFLPFFAGTGAGRLPASALDSPLLSSGRRHAASGLYFDRDS